MIFKKLDINGAYLIKPNKKYDNRGCFFRTFCSKTFYKKKIKFEIKQCNLSFNKKKYTFRGLHYSLDSHKENKILSVVRGSIENHMIDLRKKSKTFLKKIKLKINSNSNYLIVVPTGCANGFLTLEDNTLVNYYMDNFFSKKNVYRGIRYNDPFFGLKLEKSPRVLSKKDSNIKNSTF